MFVKIPGWTIQIPCEIVTLEKETKCTWYFGSCARCCVHTIVSGMDPGGICLTTLVNLDIGPLWALFQSPFGVGRMRTLTSESSVCENSAEPRTFHSDGWMLIRCQRGSNSPPSGCKCHFDASWVFFRVMMSQCNGPLLSKLIHFTRVRIARQTGYKRLKIRLQIAKRCLHPPAFSFTEPPFRVRPPKLHS